jgi:Tfp pilus assembly PilM family ATPase
MLKTKAKEEKDLVIDGSKPRRVAIDIGLHSVKCAYLEDNLLYLEEHPLLEQPKDINDLDPHQLIDHQMSAVRTAINMVDKKAEIILSPQPSLQVVTRILQPPLDTNLSEFIEKELPFERDKFALDVQQLSLPDPEKKSAKSVKNPTKIVLSAADLGYVHRSIGALGEFQLQIKRLTPASIGLLNYVLLSENGKKGLPVVLLDLGAAYSHVLVYKERDQFLARTLELGGNHLNREMMERLNVDFETAEKIKMESTMIDDGLFDSQGSTKAVAMFQAINGFLYNLVDEIKNSMTFFEDFFMVDISNAMILLAGGTSGLENLDRFLSKELGLSVKTIKDSAYTLAPISQFAPQFASTVGLLGESTHSDLFHINLLNNIEGLLFKLQEGDYYLTREGFIPKKRYKKIQRRKARESARLTKPILTGAGKPTHNIIPLLKDFPERVKSTLKGERRALWGPFRQLEKVPAKEHLKYMVLTLGALFLVSAAVYQFLWSPKMNRLNRTMASYLQKTVELDPRRAPLTTNKEVQVYTVTRTDKILWTNKLKNIALALPKKVWISDLEIQGSAEKLKGIRLDKRALTLICHVSSDTQDHLMAIAQFIKNLKSQKEFIKDFTDVKFHSAARNPENKDTLDFSLTFPLKRNLLEERVETVVKEKG